MKSQIIKFGFEIEGEFGREVRDKMASWGGIKGDGSISRCPNNKHPQYTDLSMAEFASRPITYGTHIRKVNTIFNYLLRMKKGGKFHWNNSCGFHIHVSFSNDRPTELISKEFLQFFAKKLEKDFKTVHRVRGANSYCKIPSERIFEDDGLMNEWMRNERYSFINVYPALQKHGTIEFRIFPANTPNSMKKYLLYTLKAINEFIDNQDLYMRRDESFEIVYKPRTARIRTQSRRNEYMAYDNSARNSFVVERNRNEEFTVNPYQRRSVE